MKQSGRVPWGEVRVGIIIIFAFAVLLWAAFNGKGMSFFEKTHTLQAYFDDVGGLVTGSPVWLGGIEVGHVSHIRFVEQGGRGRIHVSFAVRDAAWNLVSDSSTVAVATMGLMGDKFLSISVRSPGQPPATPGNTLAAAASTDLTSAFSGAPDLVENLDSAIVHMRSIVERVEHGEGYLGRIISNGRSSDEIDSAVAASRRLMVDLQDAQKRLVTAMERASGSFDSLSQGILHGGGTLSRLVWDSSLYVELTDVARRANGLVARWDRGEGTLGKLAADSSMYVEARSLMTETRTLLDDLMKNPRKYFKFSVF